MYYDVVRPGTDENDLSEEYPSIDQISDAMAATRNRAVLVSGQQNLENADYVLLASCVIPRGRADCLPDDWHIWVSARSCCRLSGSSSSDHVIPCRREEFSTTRTNRLDCPRGMLVQLEIASINADRRASSQHEDQARAEEREKFQALIEQNEEINRHQTDAHSQQMKQFQALLSQGNKSIQNLGKVSTSIQEASGYAGGGNSFPTISAHPMNTGDGKERLGFTFQARGRYPLFDVHVAVGRAYSVPNPTKEMVVTGTNCNLGESGVNKSTPLIAIPMDGEDAAYFVAEMGARNGFWEEVIDVRRVDAKITSRSEVVQLKNPEGPQKVLDIADEDFPQAHRYDVLYSPLFLPLPDMSQHGRLAHDQVLLLPLSSTGIGCSPPR